MKKENKKIYKIFLKPRKSKNYIVNILIGNKVKNEWENYSKNLLLQYCKNNNLGLIVFYKSFVVKKGYYSNPVFNKFLFLQY